ncbi:MAG: hypothetical protein LBB87_01625 [Nitrososphaerota archaeon]|jgi:hypothetical protein|nr:hypothetical protein [Nitrososphaerota archaeon]
MAGSSVNLAELKAAAEVWYEDGASIIPIYIHQTPDPQTGCYIKDCNFTNWGKWIKQHQTKEEFQKLNWTNKNGFAIILGYQDQNGYYLTAVDFDPKTNLKEPKQQQTSSKQFEEEFKQHKVKLAQHDLAVERGRKLLADLPKSRLELTVNGGYHILFKSRQQVRTAKSVHHACKVEVLTERQMCIMAPSFGYKLLESTDEIAIIDDFNQLFHNLCLKHNLHPNTSHHTQPHKKNTQPPKQQSPQPVELCDEKLQQIVDVFTSVWTQGSRHNLTTAFCGWFIKQNIAKNSALKLIGRLCCATDTCDSDASGFLKNVHTQYNNLKDNSDLKGWTGLLEIYQQIKGCKMPPELQKKLADTVANSAFNEKVGSKLVVRKECGLANQGYFEAIYQDDKPYFLTYNKEGIFEVYDSVTKNDDIIILPKTNQEIPYEPYTYNPHTPIQPIEVLFDRVWVEFDLFVDVEPKWVDVLSSCVLLSYRQEKIDSAPYLYIVGDNECGKTVILNLLSKLCYRPLHSVSLTPANIYGYIGTDNEFFGTILEDEAQGLDRDEEKAKLYKAGYTKGTKVARTLQTQSGRHIEYYNTFGFKASAAEKMPSNKGFVERNLFIHMTEGEPKKDWGDKDKQDEQRLQALRGDLLVWRLSVQGVDLPEQVFVVDCGVRGRLKQIWKPLLQVTAGLAVEHRLREYLEQNRRDRLEEKNKTLKSYIVRAVFALHVPDRPVAFGAIWKHLEAELDGVVDDKRQKMETPEFGVVTKRRVGSRIGAVLNAKSSRATVEGEYVVVYLFDETKLARAAKKYGLTSTQPTRSTVSTVLPIVEEAVGANLKTKKGDLDFISENTANSMNQKPSNMSVDPLENGRSVGSVGNAKDSKQTLLPLKNKTDNKTTHSTQEDENIDIFYELIVPPAEPCSCGTFAVEYVITTRSTNQTQRFCQTCFTRFREEHKNERIFLRRRDEVGANE